LLGLLDFKASV
jgi:hypothetical protein